MHKNDDLEKECVKYGKSVFDHKEQEKISAQ